MNNAVSASTRITQLQRQDPGASVLQTTPIPTSTSSLSGPASSNCLNQRPSASTVSAAILGQSNSLSSGISPPGPSGNRSEPCSGEPGSAGLIFQQSLQAAWQDLVSGPSISAPCSGPNSSSSCNSRNPLVLDLLCQRLGQTVQSTVDGAAKPSHNLVGLSPTHSFLPSSGNVSYSCSSVHSQSHPSISPAITTSSLLAALQQQTQQQQQKRPIVKNRQIGQRTEIQQTIDGLANSSGTISTPTVPPGFAATSASLAAQREAERRILAQQQQRDHRAMNFNSVHRLDESSSLSLAHFQQLLAHRQAQQAGANATGSMSPTLVATAKASVAAAELERFRLLERGSTSWAVLNGPPPPPGLAGPNQSRTETG
ncbi:unnamed protein product [Protopolystoma xenopodis]|uniref:Uncharacterized protein n=1 Tax=Protopolystoma xenopodis TaxID=117903 RepID=A0A3S5CMB2_9PLAT|nr:unnamed protein product [Protopolystoma xenopodis]